MRYLAIVGYWIAAMFIIALVMVSFDYSLARAMFLGSLYLPALLCLRLMIPQIDFNRPKEAIRDTTLIISGVTILTILLMLIANIDCSIYAGCNVPSTIINPAFVIIILFAIAIPQFALEHWFDKRQQLHPQSIEFISDRRKVKVVMNDIAYVESNDSEVWIHLVNEETYRTKTSISQWVSILDNGNFIRIHRSYLVNRLYVDRLDAGCIHISNASLPISRKYKESVQQHFALLIQPAINIEASK